MAIPILAALAAVAQGPHFTDRAASSGLKFAHHASRTSQKYLIEAMGGGVAVLDYDQDGRLDLFFVNAAAIEDPMPAGKQPDKADPRYWNRLYRNSGDGTFSDVTERANLRGDGYGMGVAAGDYDNDGHTDLYVTNLGANILHRNTGNGTFTDVTQKAGVAGGGWSTSAGFIDYDKDGRLDLVVARYLEWDFSMNIWCGERKPGYRSYCHPDQFKPITHLLYRNNGDGTFTDVSKTSGFAASPGKGLGVAFNDFNGDGWPDILIANDSFPQQLFQNKQDGTFEEIGVISGLAFDEDGRTFAGMGVDAQDYNNDGRPDIFIDALANQRYALFLNVKGAFEYVTGPSGIGGISLLHSGWGTRFVDYDNDGWKDLFVAQGHVMDNIELTQPSVRYLEPMLLARNRGQKFEDVSAAGGEAFRTPLAARGVATGDLDDDGFPDIVVSCSDRGPLLLRNQGGNGNHWLIVDPIGTTSNREGIGARVHIVTASGREQWWFVHRAGSYLSASDRRAHFGLGAESRVKLIEITWPSGVVQRMEGVAADQIVTAKEPAGRC